LLLKIKKNTIITARSTEFMAVLVHRLLFSEG